MSLYPPDGGVARHAIDLVLGLDPARWTVDLACLPGSRPWDELGALPNVALHPLGGRHGLPGASDLRDLPLLARLAGRADVIHAHSSKAGFLTRLAAAVRGRRGRTVYTPHAWSFWTGGGVDRAVYLRLERLAAHWCGTIVAVSAHERDEGLVHGVGVPAHYVVVPNGIDLAPFAAAPDPQPGRVVVVGRLAPQKRPDLSVRTAGLLRERVPGARVDLVGDGPLRTAVEALVAAEGLGEAVRVLGSRDDVPAQLAGAACLLLASDYEGCPLSVIEAMAAAVPVVTTRVGGVDELVVEGETGFVVEPGRPDLLADRLAGLLRDPARARAIGEAGRERARALFGRERMVAQTAALYERILA